MQPKIINWIRQQVRQTKTKGVVFGLSGGLDSSVTAALCLKALGKKRILALILPCETKKQDLIDARLVAKKLDIKIKSVDLGSVYKSCLKILPKANQLVRGNLKARLRMLTLYYFANRLNYLVCGTSNKSEMLMGYFTKYGDGAEDIAPLGDLLKSQVKELAKTLNIPGKIIDKTPTAGLWPAQTDEGELGISYAKLDDILLGLAKKQRQIQPVRLVNKVKARIKASEHKRQPPKICKI
ncbi:MAG: NAD+ synthase [Candidatus Omnitrophota bacterium]|jgi:NAD+ synthase